MGEAVDKASTYSINKAHALKGITMKMTHGKLQVIWDGQLPEDP
jgi:hypothetical protein